MTKILHLEDNEDNLYLLIRSLGRKAYDVIVASDDGLGVETAQGEHRSLFLMD